MIERRREIRKKGKREKEEKLKATWLRNSDFIRTYGIA